MRKAAKRSSRARLGLYHLLLLGAVFAVWYALTTPGLVSEEFAKNTAFFFGKPIQVLLVVWEWFASGKIYPHLAITLVETLLAFIVGSVLGLGIGLWLALSPTASALSDRVVVLSAGPATRPLGDFAIDLPRPRDVAEIRMSPRFVELHEAIWQVLKSEVLKGYAQAKRA